MSYSEPNPEDPIYVTRPLAAVGEVTKLLEGVWEQRILTNGGPLHQQLEQELAAYLGVEHISLCQWHAGAAGGTQSLRLQGEVITTPFSFVAAASVELGWLGASVRRYPGGQLWPRSFNIEASIAPHHSHPAGALLRLPCDVEAIQRIADDYNLKVIYDAAHAFGVNCHCGSLLHVI